MSSTEEFFRSAGVVRTYRKGQIICWQGEPFEQVCLIASGLVKMYDIDANGSERTITMYSASSIFPISWLLKESPPAYLYFYEAFSDTACYVLSVEKAKEFVTLYPEILQEMLDMVTKGYLNFIGRVQNLEKSRINERLEFVLYWLAIRLGKEWRQGVFHIQGTITQEDLARLAGVTRESMSHTIKHTRVKDLFWRQGGDTYIDIGQLDTDSMPKIFYP